MTAVIVQFGILGQQLLGIVGQVKCGVIANGLDPQHFTQAQHRVKAGATHPVVERTVHGRKGNIHCKRELTHAFILLADFLADNFR